jgi:hypothetical protein
VIEARTKGVRFASARAFVAERFGERGWDEALDRLTPADREAVSAVLPVGWYALALYVRLIRAIDEAHGVGDLALAVQLGRFEAERDVATTHRALLRVGSPALALDRHAELWRRTHDSGSWTLTRDGATSMFGVLSELGVDDHALCRVLVGYLGRLLDLVGARSARIEHPRCRALGDAECLFRARWGADTAQPESCTTPIASAVAEEPRQELASGAVQVQSPASEPAISSRQAFAASVEKLKTDSKKTAGRR